MAVASPRFEAAPMIRIREQILAGIQARSLDPSARGEVAWREAIYPGHPYARSDEGTAMSLASIATDDLVAAHRALFARSNLVVGVVGAIDAETLKTRLDEVFGGLPQEPSLKPIDETEPRLDQQIRVEYDLPQATIQIAWPGVSRDDPAFFAAYLMNHIFGGGTFSSRLFDEIREKRGLAYGVDSSLYTRDYSNALVVSTATRSDRAAETLAIIRDEARRMAQDGPTEAELDFAKRYVTGVYAIANLGSSAAIAGTLVNLQRDGLGIDYIERRRDLLDAVTLDEVKAAAQRLLVDEPAVMIVGPPQAGEAQP
jgi:zinc protease